MIHAGTVYKKVNKDGSVEYSDMPFPGAAELTLKDIKAQNTLPSFKRPSTTNKKSARVQADTKAAISIQSPSNGETIRNNQGNLTILVQKQGSKNNKYKTQILINGAPVGEPTQASVISIKNINRGEQKIKAQLLSSSGKILATSSETVVFLHRASIIRSN